MARRRLRTIIFNRTNPMNREMDLHKKTMNYTPLPSLLLLLVQNFCSGEKIFSISLDVWIRPRCLLSFLGHLFSSPPARIPKDPAKAKLCIDGGQTKFFHISVLIGTCLQRLFVAVGWWGCSSLGWENIDLQSFFLETGAWAPSEIAVEWRWTRQIGGHDGVESRRGK